MKLLNLIAVNTSMLNNFTLKCLDFSGKGPSTKDVRQMGRGGGFEISDIPGRGEGVVCESSDVRKFLKKSKFQNSLSSLKLKLEIIIDRDSNMRAFTYDVCSNLGVSK